MEIINETRNIALEALETLKEALIVFNTSPSHPLHEIIRDAVIKRFEYSMDCFWKYLRNYIEKDQKIILEKISAKSVFRACLNNNLIDETEFNILIQMVDDRNLTSHSYNQVLAEAISIRINGYTDTMIAIVNRFR